MSSYLITKLNEVMHGFDHLFVAFPRGTDSDFFPIDFVPVTQGIPNRERDIELLPGVLIFHEGLFGAGYDPDTGQFYRNDVVQFEPDMFHFDGLEEVTLSRDFRHPNFASLYEPEIDLKPNSELALRGRIYSDLGRVDKLKTLLADANPDLAIPDDYVLSRWIDFYCAWLLHQATPIPSDVAMDHSFIAKKVEGRTGDGTHVVVGDIGGQVPKGTVVAKLRPYKG